MSRLDRLGAVSAASFPWSRWEKLIEDRGVEIDRHRGSRHPDHESIIYPIDYGYVPDTMGSDGQPVDVFVGTADNGLVALIVTVDHRKKDREFKLIYNCSPEEIYLVNGFINFDRRLMEGELVMRRPMQELW
ncbi:MAG: inorganic diphosphatase [Rhodothermales bacterium]|nr:inorganic diphosphatase [Rhodothermales bacterium]